jgi:hypothetical protein
MIYLLIALAAPTYAVLAGVSRQLLDRYTSYEVMNSDERAVFSVIWPITLACTVVYWGVWRAFLKHPFKLLAKLYDAPSQVTKAIADHREAKRLPEARVVNKCRK